MKSHDPLEFSNLRPISILSALLKVLKKIAFKQLLGHSWALLSITDDIFSSLNKDSMMTMFYSNFYTANYRILLSILHYIILPFLSIILDIKEIKSLTLVPLLFVIYTSLIYKSLKFCNYPADTTQIYRPFTEKCHKTCNL